MRAKFENYLTHLSAIYFFFIKIIHFHGKTHAHNNVVFLVVEPPRGRGISAFFIKRKMYEKKQKKLNEWGIVWGGDLSGSIIKK